MTTQDAINYIATAVQKALKTRDVEFSSQTDLLQDKILDSLEGIVFIMELTDLTGKEFPEEVDLARAGLFKIGNLVDYLTDKKNISDFSQGSF